MMNFCQFWNKLNGEPYTDGVPAPVQYDIGTLSGDFSSHELRPLQPEDMSQASAEEVAANYVKLHNGKNPCRLGREMTDEELKKFYGQTW